MRPDDFELVKERAIKLIQRDMVEGKVFDTTVIDGHLLDPPVYPTATNFRVSRFSNEPGDVLQLMVRWDEYEGPAEEQRGLWREVSIDYHWSTSSFGPEDQPIGKKDG